MEVSEASNLISEAVGDTGFEEALRTLIWFGFLGVLDKENDKQQFAYDIGYNLAKIQAVLSTGKVQLVVHPAFRTSLGCQ